MSAPAIVMPRRRWADEPAPEAPRPQVLVSSYDGAEVPYIPRAAALARAAEAAGWTVGQTYALAEVPATSRRAAHRLGSVAVRLRRDRVAAWAVWYRVDSGTATGAWRFASAVLGLKCVGFRELVTAVSAS